MAIDFLKILYGKSKRQNALKNGYFFIDFLKQKKREESKKRPSL
jgi:hypothetical protein